MTYSASYDFSMNRDDIITFALKKIGVIPEDGTPSTAQVTTAALELNMLYKTWEANGLQLWARKLAVLFPETDTVEYTVGPYWR